MTKIKEGNSQVKDLRKDLDLYKQQKELNESYREALEEQNEEINKLKFDIEEY